MFDLTRIALPFTVRWCRKVLPMAAAKEPWMKAMPGGDGDFCVTKVSNHPRCMRCWPARVISALESVFVMRETSAGLFRPVRTKRRITIKDTVIADAGKYLAALVLKFVTRGNRVIASIEYKQWSLFVLRQQLDKTLDLDNGRGALVDEWHHTHHVKGCTPAVG